MKKIFLSLFVFMFTTLIVFADKVPTTSKSIRNYGIGVLKIDSGFYVYTNPDENSKIISAFDIQPQKTAIVRDTRKILNPFIVSVPASKNYFVTVSEYPEHEWIQIYYNQNGAQTGWVRLSDKQNFMTWKEFFLKYGKKNGLSLMKDSGENNNKLYAQDSTESKVVDDFMYPEFITCRMIRGNWMLITVVESGNVYKTGWFKWRNDDGKLLLFPNMKKHF